MSDSTVARFTPDQLDDRFALAVSMINDQLFNADLPPIVEADLEVLRDPAGYRALVLVMGSAADVNLSHALALLDEWHAWHGR